MEEISLSVRELTEFLLRSGDIDNRFGGLDRALKGARIHRKLQKMQGEAYQAEVAFTYIFQFHSYCYKIRGRADGLIIKDGQVIIDEIKTTGRPLDLVSEGFSQAHWGQAMCYAYFYCEQNSIEEITVRLTYFHIETEEIKQFEKVFTHAQLRVFF